MTWYPRGQEVSGGQEGFRFFKSSNFDICRIMNELRLLVTILTQVDLGLKICTIESQILSYITVSYCIA